MTRRGKEVALDQLVRVLDQVPLVSSIKNDLSGLRALLLDRRSPRIAALGRTSSGRSSLLRALIERRPIREPLHADHGQWVRLEHEGAKVDWLEIDIDCGRISWASPIARLLTGREVGDEIAWPRGGKEVTVEIIAIS